MFGPLCVSIAEVKEEQASRQLRGLACAELRLDALDPMPEDLTRLVRLPEQCLLTCRPGELTAEEQGRRLLLGLAAEPALLDLDLDAPKVVRQSILDRMVDTTCGLVLSRHWYRETPRREILQEAVGAMLHTEADVVKVAAFCHTVQDLANLMGLYGLFPSQCARLVVLGMGPLGTLSRLAILQLGAPFTFVAPDMGALTAPGQIRLTQARRILEDGGLM